MEPISEYVDGLPNLGEQEPLISEAIAGGRGSERRSTATPCYSTTSSAPWKPTIGRAGPASRRAGPR